jgi:signal transduction histidine kinase
MPETNVDSNIEATQSATEQRYLAFIHNSLEGIWRFELDAPIPTSWPRRKQIEAVFRYAYLAEANDAMSKMYGLKSASQLIGARLSDLMSKNVEQNRRYLEAFITSGYNLQGMESEEVDAKGNKKYFLNSLVGVIEDGAVVRAWGTQLDVSRQHQMTAALKQSQERLDLALKVSRLGMWEWNVASGELTWSDELRKIYQVPAKGRITYELYLSRIHPADRIRIQETIKKSMETGKSYEAEHRIVWPNEEVHWVLSRGKTFFENGKPSRMAGSCINIDIRKSAEDLKVRNALLNAERNELMRLNKSKDEFIALASHQLRTPATGVKQFLGMLLEGYAGDLSLTPEQLHMLQTAYDSNERQIAVVNDLLMVATIDAGKVTLQRQDVDIVSYVREIAEDYKLNCADRKQQIAFECQLASQETNIDDVRLRMAIENLLDNACKYSPEGATTTVSVKKMNHKVAIAVTDQGVGIDKKDFAKLFQKFSRIPNPLSVSSGGSGLGLYWAHRIVELHGGKFEVSSAPGKGSTFTITLPL